MDVEFLRPTELHRVIDLVESIGFDVTDWGNFKGGKEKAAMNPKYCYSWSFEDRSKNLIALNLWFSNVEIQNGNIVQNLNLRDAADRSTKSLRKRRAIEMDFLLQTAARLDMPVRVIICDGSHDNDGADKRMLDSEPWYVGSYDSATGKCVLIRGLKTELYIDQFEIEELPEGNVDSRDVTAKVYERCPKIRRFVLNRAKGRCEWCDEEGFKTAAGSIYLETHHVYPLSENGADNIDNVIGICPNDHRQAHYGMERDQFKKDLKDRVVQRNLNHHSV